MSKIKFSNHVDIQAVMHGRNHLLQIVCKIFYILYSLRVHFIRQLFINRSYFTHFSEKLLFLEGLSSRVVRIGVIIGKKFILFAKAIKFRFLTVPMNLLHVKQHSSGVVSTPQFSLKIIVKLVILIE